VLLSHLLSGCTYYPLVPQFPPVSPLITSCHLSNRDIIYDRSDFYCL